MKLTDEQKQNIPFVGTCYEQRNNYSSNAGGYASQNTYTSTASATDIDESIF